MIIFMRTTSADLFLAIKLECHRFPGIRQGKRRRYQMKEKKSSTKELLIFLTSLKTFLQFFQALGVDKISFQKDLSKDKVEFQKQTEAARKGNPKAM